MSSESNPSSLAEDLPSKVQSDIDFTINQLAQVTNNERDDINKLEKTKHLTIKLLYEKYDQFTDTERKQMIEIVNELTQTEDEKRKMLKKVEAIQAGMKSLAMGFETVKRVDDIFKLIPKNDDKSTETNKTQE